MVHRFKAFSEILEEWSQGLPGKGHKTQASNTGRSSTHSLHYSGNKLGCNLGEVVCLQEQISPYFQLREKSKCIEYIGKSKFQSKTREREVTSP